MWSTGRFLTVNRTNLTYNRAVKAVGVYVIVGFVVMEILYFGVWCRPFNQYWAVPTDNGIYCFLRLAPSLLLILCSSMLNRNTSPHHECNPQHLIRHHDHNTSYAPISEIQCLSQDQSALMLHLHCRRLYGMYKSITANDQSSEMPHLLTR